MKTLLFALLVGISAFMTAQNSAPSSVLFQPLEISKTECISDALRLEVLQEIEVNKRIILQENPNAFQQRNTHPLFILPFRPKSGYDDYGYYSLFNQVDHDSRPNGKLLDYNCGERSYDWASGNHAGTDYVVWPYPWKKMEDDVMEVIAAAPGIIVQKKDGNFDKNCANNGNQNWNGIILEHPDGSRTWYWHFKNGSATSKNVGDTVASGEYLGRAGSSGSSDIPHLHFEVHDSAGLLIDPYGGPCNAYNSESWWVNQPDYFVPEILTLSTHNTDSYDMECGVVENTYRELNFEPGETVRFRIFFRDLQTNSITHIKVTKPDGSILYDYNFVSEWVDYSAVWAQWLFPIDNTSQDGVHTVTVQFGGNTYETIFGVNTELSVEGFVENKITLYPNPATELVYVNSVENIDAVGIYDLTGRQVQMQHPNALAAKVDVSGFSSGVYLVKVASGAKTQTFKISKL